VTDCPPGPDAFKTHVCFRLLLALEKRGFMVDEVSIDHLRYTAICRRNPGWREREVRARLRMLGANVPDRDEMRRSEYMAAMDGLLATAECRRAYMDAFRPYLLDRVGRTIRRARGPVLFEWATLVEDGFGGP
jgi:hypothetical protein